MYGSKTLVGWEGYSLTYGDRLVINWHRRTFRAVRRLASPFRLRMTGDARDFVMGIAQPEWQRLWMQHKSGEIVRDLPLPESLKESCAKDADPFILLPQFYGFEAVGGEALKWSWQEEAELGRRILRHTSYLSVNRF